MHDDAFGFGLFDLFQRGGHFMTLLKAYQADFASAHAQCRQRDVHHLVRSDGLRVFFRGSHLARRVMLAQHLTRGRSRDVHGDVAAADDQHLLADGELVAEIDVEQKLDAAMHAIEIDTRYRQVTAAVCADRDQHRVEALPPQFADGEVAPGGGVQAQRDVAGFEDLAHLRLDHTSRQTILRDAEVQHSAGDRRSFEDGDRVAHQRQIVCG